MNSGLYGILTMTSFMASLVFAAIAAVFVNRFLRRAPTRVKPKKSAAPQRSWRKCATANP